MYKDISTYELKKLLVKKDLNLIDIRDSYTYLSGTIGNAKNISYNVLLTEPNRYLDKNKEYYIFCNSGFTSNNLCNYLNSLGYNTVNIVGGYNSYIKDSK